MLALFLYRLLLILLFPLLLIALLLRSRTQKAYRQRLAERLGLIDSNFQSGGIVIHGSSVGEILALRPFIDAVLARWPELPITVTTFTPTGSEQVTKLYGDKVQHCYLPLDIDFFVRAFLGRLKPKALVLMETELWPVLINSASKKDIGLLLINGRLTEKSQAQYQKFSALVEPTLAKFNQILCQSDDNATRFKAIGAPEHKTRVSGNLKYDLRSSEAQQQKTKMLKSFIEGERKVVVVGSTHAGDEQIVLEAYRKLKAKLPELLLVIVPRHPERFGEVGDLVTAQNFKLAKRSRDEIVTHSTDVWLIDTLGELLAVYALSDVCIIGGSFSHIGGHNPLEAALFSKPIVCGSNMSNFHDMNELLKAASGIAQLTETCELESTLFSILTDSNKASELGTGALKVIEQNQGATKTSIDALSLLVDERANK